MSDSLQDSDNPQQKTAMSTPFICSFIGDQVSVVVTATQSGILNSLTLKGFQGKNIYI